MQAYTPDTITFNADTKYFKIKHSEWRDKTLYQLYQQAYTPWQWFKRLKSVADDLGILFFSTAFDKTSVDLLEGLNVPVHKIASFELVDLPLIEYVAKTKKPLILSTGMANIREIKEAVNTAKKAGAKDIVILRCVSNYPANPKDMNLKTIPYLKKLFRLPVGISDHTLGLGASIAAVSLGASIVEKHLTLSRSEKTTDSFFSMEPDEFKMLVDNIRIAKEAVGKVSFKLNNREKDNRLFRRSLFAVEDIKKNEFFTEENIRSIRPAYGLKPKYLSSVIGKRAKKDIKKGTPLHKRWVY